MPDRPATPPQERNAKVYDAWSYVHVFSGTRVGWLLPAPLALLLIALHEPFETQLLSPFLWKRFGIIYGYEALPNSLGDIGFGTLGLIIGHFVLGMLISTPLR